MNTESNKEKWIKMVNDTLTMGGKSKITINKYTYAIERFLNAHSNNTKISTFTEKEIIKYLKKKFIDTNLKATTYNFNLAAISYFYGLCFEKEFNKKLLPKAKLAKKLPTILDKETFINLVNNENNIEHKCWLLLGFCCGLRASEVSRIKIEDIDVNNHKLKIIGKGNKERYTILPDICINMLRQYCKYENITYKTGYLFPGCDGEIHISSRTISNYFTLYAKAINLPKNISFHTLRHSFATYYLMNGGEQFVLKDMLGHQSLATTAIYVHLANDFNNLKGINYNGKQLHCSRDISKIWK